MPNDCKLFLCDGQDFEGFDLANENDVLLPFLHMAVPIEEPPAASNNNTDDGEEEEGSSSLGQETPPPSKPKPAKTTTDDENMANGTGSGSSREVLHHNMALLLDKGVLSTLMSARDARGIAA